VFVLDSKWKRGKKIVNRKGNPKQKPKPSSNPAHFFPHPALAQPAPTPSLSRSQSARSAQPRARSASPSPRHALALAPSNRPSGPTLQWHPGPRVGAPSPEWARSPHHPARFFSPLPAQQAARACSTTPSAPGLPRTPLPHRAGPLSAPDTPGPSVRSPSPSFPPPRNCSARDDRRDRRDPLLTAPRRNPRPAPFNLCPRTLLRTYLSTPSPPPHSDHPAALLRRVKHLCAAVYRCSAAPPPLRADSAALPRVQDLHRALLPRHQPRAHENPKCKPRRAAPAPPDFRRCTADLRCPHVPAAPRVGEAPSRACFPSSLPLRV